MYHRASARTIPTARRPCVPQPHPPSEHRDEGGLQDDGVLLVPRRPGRHPHRRRGGRLVGRRRLRRAAGLALRHDPHRRLHGVPRPGEVRQQRPVRRRRRPQSVAPDRPSRSGALRVAQRRSARATAWADWGPVIRCGWRASPPSALLSSPGWRLGVPAAAVAPFAKQPRTDARGAPGPSARRVHRAGRCRRANRPETLRRLRHAIVDRQPGQLKDDATAVLVEWHRGAEADLLPRTARQQAVARSVLTNLTTGLRRDERGGAASRLSAAARS
jgi:hypothetical protein